MKPYVDGRIHQRKCWRFRSRLIQHFQSLVRSHREDHLCICRILKKTKKNKLSNLQSNYQPKYHHVRNCFYIKLKVDSRFTFRAGHMLFGNAIWEDNRGSYFVNKLPQKMMIHASCCVAYFLYMIFN